MSNTGQLMNKGYITVTGNWDSQGTCNGNGTLELNGNGPQKITHYNQTLSALIVNGWGPKYIEGKLGVQGQFYLRRGIVEVSADDELSMEEGSVILGGSEESYVDGALTVEGTGYHFFPIGKDGVYAPIEFLKVKGEDPRFSVEAFSDAPVISIPNAIVRNGMYWRRRQISGDFDGSRLAIAYDPLLFKEREKMIMVTGSAWDVPFNIVSEVTQSSETPTVITNNEIREAIIMLGEVSEHWTEADFYFSTALSPHARNSDNRKARIFGERLSAEQFHLVVFNRWGRPVYESRSLDEMTDNGWDGHTMTGEALMPGTYPYRLTAIDKTGSKFEKKGVITILY